MRALKYFALVLFILAAGSLLWSAFLPNQFVLQQQITIHADSKQIFAYVGHLERWPKWVYWYRDPVMPVKRIGMNQTQTRVGTQLDWRYEGIMGYQRITKYIPNQLLGYEVRWGKRLQQMHCQIRLNPNLPLENSTNVQWFCLGVLFENPFLRLMSVWTKPIQEANFKKSLFLLKKYAEADFAAQHPRYQIPPSPLLPMNPIQNPIQS